MIEISWSLENARSEPDTAQDIIIPWAVIHIKISAIMVSFCSMWGVGQSIKVPSVTWDHKLTVLTQLLLYIIDSFLNVIHSLLPYMFPICISLPDWIAWSLQIYRRSLLRHILWTKECHGVLCSLKTLDEHFLLRIKTNQNQTPAWICNQFWKKLIYQPVCFLHMKLSNSVKSLHRKNDHILLIFKLNLLPSSFPDFS